ncbi:MAG: 3-phosphoshikimate 1-carboxyvinyltransferase [Verrucomicrobia bacterium]|nr:3-phosphoshikimate 1-carboxyvinyltransferase [Verrucomicrobiota bacterium]
MLPETIEIVPLPTTTRATVRVPGSKSITNRALALAALTDGETVLRGALWSEDTQVMVECLRHLGFMVNVAPDPVEPCNRTLTVHGRGGQVPRGGTLQNPLALFVANAGTAARFLAALVCLGSGVYRLHGVPRMHLRPQEALFNALRQLGYQIDAPADRLPALIHGGGPRPGRCAVSIQESSQFASALLLASRVGGWEIETHGENAEESPYVAMTARLLEQFPHRGGEFQIEPDASSGSYFWGAGHWSEGDPAAPKPGEARLTHCSIRVADWPNSGWQVDERCPGYLAAIQGAGGHWPMATPPGEPALVISRQTDLGDSIMTGIVLAALGAAPVRFTDLARLRLQECERVLALRTELTRCGAQVNEHGDSLTVIPSRAGLRPAEIETYDDHRMAMCFATLGLKVPGIKIKNPACVRKTFPGFFQKLVAPPPHGLGATILDYPGGRRLDADELFAH